MFVDLPTNRVTAAPDLDLRDAEFAPIDLRERVASSGVSIERQLPGVLLVTLILERQLRLDVREVGAGDESTIVEDLVLRHWQGESVLAEQRVELRFLLAFARHAIGIALMQDGAEYAAAVSPLTAHATKQSPH